MGLISVVEIEPWRYRLCSITTYTHTAGLTRKEHVLRPKPCYNRIDSHLGGHSPNSRMRYGSLSIPRPELTSGSGKASLHSGRPSPYHDNSLDSLDSLDSLNFQLRKYPSRKSDAIPSFPLPRQLTTLPSKAIRISSLEVNPTIAFSDREGKIYVNPTSIHTSGHSCRRIWLHRVDAEGVTFDGCAVMELATRASLWSAIADMETHKAL